VTVPSRLGSAVETVVFGRYAELYDRFVRVVYVAMAVVVVVDEAGAGDESAADDDDQDRDQNGARARGPERNGLGGQGRSGVR